MFPTSPIKKTAGMAIYSLGQHWPARKMEWVMAGLALTWGTYVLLHPEMFFTQGAEPMFRGMVAMTPGGIEPHVFWGCLAATVGLLRLIALYVNGAHVRTPVVRVITAFLTMFVFTQVALGLYQGGVPNTGLAVYPWLVFADMVSAYAAGQDAIRAEVQKRIDEGTINDNSRLSRSLARP